tara:strand:+ start:3326 stop:3751 length:426 start_codon:yes stop_codon:yes gene_type:complete
MENDHRVYELRDPKYWGPTFWKFLYLSAMGLPYTLTATHKRNYENLIKNFSTYLPCAECRYHYMNTLKSKVFTLETREDVLLTILGIHNSVRKRQQKKDYDYEDVMSYHYNDMIWGATSNQQIIQYALVSIIIFCFLRKIR